MSREEIRVEGLAEPISHFTDAVRAGGFLHVSGIVAVDGAGRLVGGDDVVAQTRQVLDTMRSRARRGRVRLRGRREGHDLPHRHRRSPEDQPAAPGGVRRDAAGVDARRGAAARRHWREGRDRVRGARSVTATPSTRSSRRSSPGRPETGHSRAGRSRSRISSTRPESGRRTARVSTRDHIPDRTASVVQRLVDAGAVVVGKTNLPEFAWGVLGTNEFHGTCLNPTHPGKTTGGSSAGSAAALAAGLCELALGTDTGASIRLPAAACEVVGPQVAVGADPEGRRVPARADARHGRADGEERRGRRAHVVAA